MPAGWYAATITKAEVKPTKSGTGEYLNLCYSILGPTHQGRTVWGIVNLRNANPKAEEIGRQQLGELMRATGLARVNDSDEFIGKAVSIKLVVKSEENYGDKNEIKGWKALDGAVNAGGGLPMPALSNAPGRTKAAPPWPKK